MRVGGSNQYVFWFHKETQMLAETKGKQMIRMAGDSLIPFSLIVTTGLPSNHSVKAKVLYQFAQHRPIDALYAATEFLD